MTPAPKFKWTAEADAELTRLWADGWPTRAIGLELGVSKNSICGRRDRLDLPARPSPIPAAAAAPKAAKPTNFHPARAVVALPVVVAAPKPQPPPPQPATVFRARQAGGCQWLEDEPNLLLWCGEPTVLGTSWCRSHHARCYRQVAA
jgi:hypothetical protein